MNTTQIAAQLWQRLWLDYRCRVPYARLYQEMIEESQGIFANDHIAFRSLQFSVEGPHGTLNLGIPYLEEMVTRLGYKRAGDYEFPEQHLFARHYAPPTSSELELPKLFISELTVDSLPSQIASLIRDAVSWDSTLDQSLWGSLPPFNEMSSDQVLSHLQSRFSRIWSPPFKSTVETVNQISQYGAWVLLHGYSVNHFTGFINRHHSGSFPTLEATAQALAQMGVPMKATIEGSQASGLRQTATQAIVESVMVKDSETEEISQMPWPYAYFELAERYPMEPNSPHLFEGFLTQQAKQLFEMTRREV